MITANIAGSASGHVRHSDRQNRSDSDCSYSSTDLEDIERKIECKETADFQNGGTEYTEEERLALEEEARRIRQLIIEHRRKKFCKDYKTWGYLLCVASVVIGAIVLIVLAGMGLINTTARR